MSDSTSGGASRNARLKCELRCESSVTYAWQGRSIAATFNARDTFEESGRM